MINLTGRTISNLFDGQKKSNKNQHNGEREKKNDLKKFFAVVAVLVLKS